MKYTFITILTFLTLTVFGQNPIKKIIYFGAGKSSLSVLNKQQLDSIVDKIKDKSFQVILTGHADTTGNEQVNLEISKKRTLSVSNYFISKGIDKTLIENKYLGELNPIFKNSPEVERVKNRCVEVVIQFKGSSVAIKEEAENIVSEKVKFENDTVIRLGKGTQIEISAETFYPRKIKDIDFEITEIFSLCDMLSNNTVTRSSNGDCLTSAGMLFIRPTIAGIEIQPNEGKLVKIKIPTMGGTIDKSMKLYGGVKDKNGQFVWKDLAPEVSYEESGNQFYVFKVDTLSSFNLDKPMGIICRKDGHKIKVPKEIKDVRICQTYPNEKYLAVAEKLNERKFTLDKVVKEKKPIITIIGFDKLGSPYIAQGPLYELKYRKWRDMYVVNKKYFKKELIDYSNKMTANDYLCNYLDN